jgi:lysophospholipase L1-like esterase
VPDLPRAKDNIHPTMSARKAWAKAVIEWLREHRDPEGDLPWSIKADAP